MGIMEKMNVGEFRGLSNVFSSNKHSAVPTGVHSTPTGGLGNGGHAPGSKIWDDEDGSGALNISLRGLQTFLPFIGLCIYIAIAAFQKKWGVGISFLTGLALFFNVEALLHAGLFLATPLLYDKIKMFRSLARGLRQIRTAVIINAFQVVFMIIISLVTTISAYSGGCKNPDSDPNKEIEGYLDALPGFCRNKRAGAAFFWLTFLAWATSLGITLLTWYKIRKNPRSTGFAIPGSQFPQDDEEAFAHQSDSDQPQSHPRVRAGLGPEGTGYRASGDFNEGGLFSEGAPEYGYGGGAAQGGKMGGGEEVYHPRTTDPFADQSDGRYGYESSADPYEQIRKSMDVDRSTRY